MLTLLKYPGHSRSSWRKRILLSLIAFLVCMTHVVAQSEDSTRQAVHGIMDLRETFYADLSIPLNGTWGFFRQELLTSEQKLSDFAPVPAVWKDVISEGGDQMTSKGYATYQLKLLLPEDHDNLGLQIPDLNGSYALYANGQLVASEGIVDSIKENYQLSWRNQVVPLGLLLSDTLVLTLQMANFDLFDGGIEKSIVLGDYDQLHLTYLRTSAIDWTLAGCLFMAGLFFFGFFLFGAKDPAVLFFSLFCIVFSLRMPGTSNYSFYEIFPGMGWEALMRLEYMTLVLPGIFFSYHIRYLYPEDVHKFVIWFFAALSGIFGIVSLASPANIFQEFLPYYLFAIALFSLYCSYVFIRAASRKRPGAEFGIWSNIAALIVFSVILLHYFGYIPALRGIQMGGYVLFFFLQSLVLFQRFSFTLVRARKEAEAGMQEKSNFLSTMSHEIRTPLNAVIGITELLKTTSMDEKEMTENVELLSFSANNLLAIINDILDFSKIDAGKVRFESVEMDVQAIIEKVVKSNQSIAAKKSIKLNIYVNSNVPKIVKGDPLRLTQVLNNLMNNALKFTDYGYVTITVDRVVRDNSNVTLSFQVIDTGIGIPEEKLGGIFEAFAQADSSTTRSFGGTGLGLTITSRLLQLQGSELKVESKLGKGTVFYFLLDFGKYTGDLTTINAHNNNHHPAPQRSGKDIANASILLTEDNDLNIFFTKKHLEKWGARVSVAHNGKEAVDMVNNNFDLILMDLQMPLMDGFEASTIIRKSNKQVPIIAFTANTESTVKERVILAGMNDIITKPFAPDMLRNLIAKYL